MAMKFGARLNICKRMLSRQDLMNYTAKNEPFKVFAKGSPEREDLIKMLDKFKTGCVEIPTVIGDEQFYGVGKEKFQPCPFDHGRHVAKYNLAGPELLQKAIKQALDARKAWDATPYEKRAEIFLRAADLLAGKYRSEVLAATIIGQGKTVIQAEIDAAVEMVDFLRFNVQFLGQALQYQPVSTNVSTNTFHLRGTEGFWTSISPFNFTCIGGNLSATPALMGNVCLWKASHSAVWSNYVLFKVMREAGLPPNILQFVPSQGSLIGKVITSHPDLAGITFTGGVPAFHALWTQVGQNIGRYKNLPRMMGELGGKNFHFVHPTCDDINTVVNGTIQAAFEYAGQKCSACSRLYVPKSLWPEFKKTLLAELSKVKVGSPLEFENFFSAVIDDESCERMKKYIRYAVLNSKECTILHGGVVDDSKGYFIQPTVIQTTNPTCLLMQEEIFGPILTVFVYEDSKVDETMKLIDETTQYALTGAIFTHDKAFIEKAKLKFRDSCGNFYVNDKCTGAMVGNQPFGGARWSGTNDKAGGPHFILRFVSAQTHKETHFPIKTWRYPYMD